jgi:hypothetical protein
MTAPESMPQTEKRIADPLYPTVADALKAVRDDYDYWTGKLTESSFALSLAIIAANWAAFPSVDTIRKHGWSKASIAAVVLNLVVNVLGAFVLGELHRRQVIYAEGNPARWEEEFESYGGWKNPWPFTACIEWWAAASRCCRVFLPLAGGVLFLIALYR